MRKERKELKKSKSAFWIFQSIILLAILASLIVLLFDFKAPGWKEREQHILEEKVRSLQELVTVDQIFRDLIYVQVKRGIAEKRVLFSILFHINAGVNLENAEVQWNNEGVPLLTIDPPEILSIDADETSIEQIFILEQFMQIIESDYKETVNDEKDRLKEEALERGILSEAEQQVRYILEQLFLMAGYSEVEIRLRGNQ